MHLKSIIDFSVFKYNINRLCSRLPNSIHIQQVATELEKYGIAQRNFFRDKSAKLHQKHDIPGERLLIYSKLFDCTIQQLFNYDKAIKPLSERKLSVQMQKLIERNDLKLPEA